jgi:anti-sigma factor RsiW
MNREEITPDSGPSPEQFAAFLDGELEAGARVRIETWLAEHPSAAEEIEGQRQVMRYWQATVPAEPSPAAWAAVYDRVEAKLRPMSRRPRAVRRTLWLSAGVAAAVLTAVLLTRQFLPGPATTKPPVIASGIITETDQELIVLASQDDVSVVNVESYWQDDGRVPSIGEGDVSMIVAAPLAADREP